MRGSVKNDIRFDTFIYIWCASKFFIARKQNSRGQENRWRKNALVKSTSNNETNKITNSVWEHICSQLLHEIVTLGFYAFDCP